jgi:hypothetical protein
VELPKKPDPEAYFSDNLFFRILRFLNLLEPDRNVLSVSKILIWMMLFLIWYVLFYMPNQLAAIISVTTGLIGTLLNYAYRRHIQALQPENSHGFFGNFRGTPINNRTFSSEDLSHMSNIDTRPPNVETENKIPTRRYPGHPERG